MDAYIRKHKLDRPLNFPTAEEKAAAVATAIAAAAAAAADEKSDEDGANGAGAVDQGERVEPISITRKLFSTAAFHIVFFSCII